MGLTVTSLRTRKTEYMRLWRAGKRRPLRATRNRASDPATRIVVDLINKSGRSDPDIADQVGVDARTIRNWRAGRHVGQPFLLECVREALAATER